MDKDTVARIIDEIGTLLELEGENSFRCNAYHNAARVLHQLEGDLTALVAEGRLGDVPGIGATLCEKITTLVKTGKLPLYDELRARVPAGLRAMLRVPGLGPKKVKALHDQLGVDDLAKLKDACETDRVASLKGFGAKTQKKILDGLAFLDSIGHRVRIDEAQVLVDRLLAALQQCPGIQRLEVCGSFRRRRETVADLDFLVACDDDSAPITQHFCSLPGVTQILAQGATKSSVLIERGLVDGRQLAIQADLRIVASKQFPFALHYFTGSKEHNIAMRALAQEHGLKLNEYELAGPKKSIACREETDLFEALGLQYIPPELREATGEIEAAAQRRLPRLVSLDEMRGTFHCHTTASDGAATLAQMADAARRLGFAYLGIADHSQSLTVANGLSPARVRKQHAEIDSLNKRLPGFTVFKGIECDILQDGSLDYNADVLATFDYVVASVHTHFNMPEAEMTARIIKAIEHPRTTMLGHATGRLLLRREGYKVDLDAVLRAAAQHGVLVEINASPYRLDLDWIHCKRAKALGVQLVVNPDAHATDEIANVRFGIDVARRGWLEAGDVFNTRSVNAVAAHFAARRARADKTD